MYIITPLTNTHSPLGSIRLASLSFTNEEVSILVIYKWGNQAVGRVCKLPKMLKPVMGRTKHAQDRSGVVKVRCYVTWNCPRNSVWWQNVWRAVRPSGNLRRHLSSEPSSSLFCFKVLFQLFIDLFIFGCTGSLLLLRVGFLQEQQVRTALSLQCMDFSWWWLLLKQNPGSRVQAQ